MLACCLRLRVLCSRRQVCVYPPAEAHNQLVRDCIHSAREVQSTGSTSGLQDAELDVCCESLKTELSYAHIAGVARRELVPRGSTGPSTQLAATHLYKAVWLRIAELMQGMHVKDGYRQLALNTLGHLSLRQPTCTPGDHCRQEGSQPQGVAASQGVKTRPPVSLFAEPLAAFPDSAPRLDGTATDEDSMWSGGSTRSYDGGFPD